MEPVWRIPTAAIDGVGQWGVVAGACYVGDEEVDGFADIDDDTPLACGLTDPDYCESCQ